MTEQPRMRSAEQVLSPVLIDDIVVRLARVEKLLEDNLSRGEISGDKLTINDTEPLPYMTDVAYYGVAVKNKGPGTIYVWSNTPGRGRPVELDTDEEVNITAKRDKIKIIYLAVKTSGTTATVKFTLLR